METTKNTPTTLAAIEALADELETEANGIGDRYGNMGPGARRRKDNLFRQINDLRKQARAMRDAQPKPVQHTGVFCTCCGQELDNEGMFELRENEGYSGCCNDTVRYA